MSPAAVQPIKMKPKLLTLDRLCIHQATLMQCDFRASIECLARHGVTKTAVWKEKLHEVGLADAVRILNDNGVEAHSYCAGGLVTACDDSGVRQAIERNRTWLDEAAEIGAKSMVIITGGLPAGHIDLETTRRQALDGIAQLVPHARTAGVKLAIEPLHPMVCGFRSVISTIDEALVMLDALDADDIMGLAFDSYSLWWEPGLAKKIRKAAPRVLNFHVSDWLENTSDLRLDRGMPGDGKIDSRSIRASLECAGFSGPVEVEIFSRDDWWTREPDDVVHTIIGRMESAL